MTFSIVACDLAAREWGAAVASKFLAVGSVVPWARAGVGAVATQAYANTSFGPGGLDLMALGYAAEDTLNGLLAADTEREHRQVGIVDREGRAATFTGSECYSWAGGRSGAGYAAQGNILVGPTVVDRMVETFEAMSGPLVDRLLRALAAGDAAGGDSRGRQSAALLVVHPRGGYGGFSDVAVDLRVDDHPTPIDELARLLGIHKLYMEPTRPEDVLPLDEDRTSMLQEILQRAELRRDEPSGHFDDATRSALEQLYGTENLEGRWRDGAEIDRVALDYLREKYGV